MHSKRGTPVIYENYPKGQSDYNGGNIQFYKELHQLILDKKIQPCENKNELYNVKFVVYPDATIKFVKEENPEKAEKNKCAFDLTRRLLNILMGGNPLRWMDKSGSYYRYDYIPGCIV